MKAIINSVTPKVWHDNAKNEDKKFQEIVFDGNKTGSSWKDDFIPFLNKEAEIEVKLTAKGKNSLSLVAGAVALAPQQNTSSAPVISQTSDVDVRKSSLLLALEVMKATGQTLSDEALTVKTKWVENYLRNGFETNPT
jgi:hypothetical protein